MRNNHSNVDLEHAAPCPAQWHSACVAFKLSASLCRTPYTLDSRQTPECSAEHSRAPQDVCYGLLVAVDVCVVALHGPVSSSGDHHSMDGPDATAIRHPAGQKRTSRQPQDLSATCASQGATGVHTKRQFWYPAFIPCPLSSSTHKQYTQATASWESSTLCVNQPTWGVHVLCSAV